MIWYSVTHLMYIYINFLEAPQKLFLTCHMIELRSFILRSLSFNSIVLTRYLHDVIVTVFIVPIYLSDVALDPVSVIVVIVINIPLWCCAWPCCSNCRAPPGPQQCRTLPVFPFPALHLSQAPLQHDTRAAQRMIFEVQSWYLGSGLPTTEQCMGLESEEGGLCLGEIGKDIYS